MASICRVMIENPYVLFSCSWEILALLPLHTCRQCFFCAFNSELCLVGYQEEHQKVSAAIFEDFPLRPLRCHQQTQVKLENGHKNAYVCVVKKMHHSCLWKAEDGADL